MNISTADRKSALHNQANQELESLVSRGLRAVGNGFSPVLLVKGDLNAAEIAGGELLAGADALAAIEDFNTAMLMPGLVAPVLGRRVLALDGFEAALADRAAKQRMWAYLKQIRPAAPY